MIKKEIETTLNDHENKIEHYTQNFTELTERHNGLVSKVEEVSSKFNILNEVVLNTLQNAIKCDNNKFKAEEEIEDRIQELEKKVKDLEQKEKMTSVTFAEVFDKINHDRLEIRALKDKNDGLSKIVNDLLLQQVEDESEAEPEPEPDNNPFEFEIHHEIDRLDALDLYEKLKKYLEK